MIDRLSINAPLDETTILILLSAYRTIIARNLLGLLEGRLVYYEPIPTVTKNNCRIIVSTSLRHTIFILMHAISITRHVREYKTFSRI